MPGPLFHVGNVTICPHGGTVQTIPSAPRVLVSGMPVAALGDISPIAGCAFTGPMGPCVLANWLVPAMRVFVMGRPALIQTSVGLCVTASQVPQGPPACTVNQPRAIAT